jgi:hypothetical protein
MLSVAVLSGGCRMAARRRTDNRFPSGRRDERADIRWWFIVNTQLSDSANSPPSGPII